VTYLKYYSQGTASVNHVTAIFHQCLQSGVGFQLESLSFGVVSTETYMLQCVSIDNVDMCVLMDKRSALPVVKLCTSIERVLNPLYGYI